MYKYNYSEYNFSILFWLYFSSVNTLQNILVDIQYISFRYKTWWLDIYMPYKVTTMRSLVSIWHHSQLFQYHWLYSLCCTWHPCDLFYTWQFLLLSSLHVFHPCTNPFPSGICYLLLLSILFVEIYLPVVCGSNSVIFHYDIVFPYMNTLQFIHSLVDGPFLSSLGNNK